MAQSPPLVMQDTIREPGDIDTFEVDLVAGEDYYLGVFGESSGGGSLPDPIFEVIDPSGSSLGVVDDSEEFGYDPFTGFEANDSGTFTIDVGGYGGGTGDYTVVLDQADSPLWEDLGLVG
jgi:hypothetical protein